MTISRSVQYSNINSIIITSDNSDWNQSEREREREREREKERERDLPYTGQNSSETSEVSNTMELIIMLSRDKS